MLLQTDLSNINSLEMRPMGDCDLARVKREFGSKISLMENIHAMIEAAEAYGWY
jgi:hypothetical protein